MSDGVVVHCTGLGMLVECAGKWERVKKKKRFKIILTLVLSDSSQISFTFI